MDTQNQIHPAEAYLRDGNKPNYLYVKINGKKRKLFFNSTYGQVGILDPGKKKMGHVFSSWNLIEDIYYPEAVTEDTKLQANRKLINKFKKLAEKATFTNSFIEAVKNADPDKDPYENKLTTGTAIDGQCITLKTINRWYQKSHFGDLVEEFKKALHERISFHSGRFDFQGYDGELWCEPRKDGGIMAGFSKEYRDCGNGYYYLLINEDTVIGVDID